MRKDNQKALCIRQVANWSSIKQEHRFESSRFNPNIVMNDMADASPKMKALFEKISELDEMDMRKDGHMYKHIIYSDVKQMGYGAKILNSGFISNGFKSLYNRDLQLDPSIQSAKNIFAYLSSSTIYGKSFPVSLRKQIIRTFNERPSNTHGQKLRFILLDSGYKEGIDLYDVKYIHIFEPSLSLSDERQVVGRGTRFCGQKGLAFHPSKGWPLYVYRYEVTIPEELEKSYGEKHLFPLYLRYSGLDIRKVIFANTLEQVAIYGAVDRMLTKTIHSFDIRDDEDDFKDFRDLFGLAPESNDTMILSAGKKKQKQKKSRILRPKPPTKFYNLPGMRRYIEERFSRYTWPPVKMENLCKTLGGAPPTMVNLTPTQNFVRLYFQPDSIYKGLLAWHSVGTGKTCTAIATASTSFEREGYSILWVTRHTLKPDIWKNMFHQVCSMVLKSQWKQGKHWPEEIDAPMRYISDRWLPPISYKQFSNLLLKKNKIYDEMVSRNGEEDPLRKTLVIIDEAHKLYTPDLPKAERPDVRILERMVHHSYEHSGKDSVRLLLMTATPYTSEPMDFIRLLNLLRTEDSLLPSDFGTFASTYLDEHGEFTSKTKFAFMNQITGYISYLNREKDARQFAYPVFENIVVPMSLDNTRETQKELEVAEDILETYNQQHKEQMDVKKEIVTRLRSDLAEELITCNDQKPKKPCIERVKGLHRRKKETIMNELEGKIKEKKLEIDNKKGQVKTLKQTIKTLKSTDLSQEKALNEKCNL